MTIEIICLQDELPIVLIITLDLETFIKGHHVYKDKSTPKQGEQLGVLMEPDNPSKERYIFYFLRSDANSSAWTKVTGKGCNLGDGEGMQVPCKLSLSGQPKFVSLLRKELIKNERNVSSDIYLVFLFPFFRVESSSYPKELASGGPKKNGLRKRMFELPEARVND